MSMFSRPIFKQKGVNQDPKIGLHKCCLGPSCEQGPLNPSDPEARSSMEYYVILTRARRATFTCTECSTMYSVVCVLRTYCTVAGSVRGTCAWDEPTIEATAAFGMAPTWRSLVPLSIVDERSRISKKLVAALTHAEPHLEMQMGALASRIAMMIPEVPSPRHHCFSNRDITSIKG